MPISSETCGRVAWKSKKFSGSTSANRCACHVLARYPAASEAAWAPSFQPRNAAISTGRVSSGRRWTRSSPATLSVYARRAPQNRHEGGQKCPNCGRKPHVGEDERPWQVRSVLDLADDHLHDQQPHHGHAEPEQARRALPPRGEVAEHEDEPDAEDGNGCRVDVDQRLKSPEPVDVLCA